VLLVSDPEGKSVLPEERLRQAYGLTRAEAALTVRLVEGMSVREAARALGVTENTAKAQLKAVFAKLEVNRQSALVRRVLGDLGGVGAVTATLNGHG
jgi:DNA-binding CsgD family transcriptional regulator